jgi:hypothetical protein
MMVHNVSAVTRQKEPTFLPKPRGDCPFRLHVRRLGLEPFRNSVFERRRPCLLPHFFISLRQAAQEKAGRLVNRVGFEFIPRHSAENDHPPLPVGCLQARMLVSNSTFTKYAFLHCFIRCKRNQPPLSTPGVTSLGKGYPTRTRISNPKLCADLTSAQSRARGPLDSNSQLASGTQTAYESYV